MESYHRLQVIENALLNDPENEILKTLKKKLEEIIEISKQLELEIKTQEKATHPDNRVPKKEEDKNMKVTKVSYSNETMEPKKASDDSNLRLLLAQKDIEILKTHNELLCKENELLCKEIQLLKLKQDKEQLEDKLRTANWDHIQTYSKIYIRQLIQDIEQKYKMSGSRNQMWKNFITTETQLLYEWGFRGPKYFMRCFWNVYNDMNKCAHPLIIAHKVIEIPYDMFTETEFQLLGLLWDLHELPLANLKIQYGYKPSESVCILKKIPQMY